jgi:very-short-patch-repair endonuclease
MTEEHVWGRPRASAGIAEARRLRGTMTPQEVKLWNRLRLLRTQGHHFRRQVPIGRGIVDFACLKARLVIEIDGGQHGREPFMKRDRERDRGLEALGFRVLRFWNAEVDENPDAMIDTILAVLAGNDPRGEG